MAATALAQAIADAIYDACSPDSEGFGVSGVEAAVAVILGMPEIRAALSKSNKAHAAQDYALGLLAEECGEVVQVVGKCFRFGLDTPRGRTGPTARDLLHLELGDVLAAIDYAAARGVVDKAAIRKQRMAKRARLLDPKSRDARGRRLAP